MSLDRPLEYQRTNSYVAQVAEGLEPLLEDELNQLGATQTQTMYKGVRFTANIPTLQAIVYQTRLANRIWIPLLTFDCHSTDYLYKTARNNLPWEQFLSPKDRFLLRATVSNSKIRHERYALYRLKDAIVDYFYEHHGARPEVHRTEPDVIFHLHLHHNRAVISMDAGGRPLHQRGYRKETGKAPVRETLAAAFIRWSGWQGDTPLIDPMCGSGTILAEALMVAANIPASYLHQQFGFMKLPEYTSTTWRSIRKKRDQAINTNALPPLLGSDRDGMMVSLAKTNLEQLPGSEHVHWTQEDFLDNATLNRPKTLITNPPYGIRLEQQKEIERLYKKIGDQLKQYHTGSTAYLLIGDRTKVKKIGLKPQRKHFVKNGALDACFTEIALY